jgi:predicted alpha/beta superfamily hydrolase
VLKNIMINLLIILFLIVSTVNCSAQEQAEIKDSIYSNILKEQRDIRVKLPDGYSPGSTDKYEVIFITDGEWNMGLFTYIYNFLRGENFVPPVIIVGVDNLYKNSENMRDRDFLPEQSPGSKQAGEADKFIGFFKNELIPYINSKYPSNGVNSLYGHSIGGLFTMYVLLKNPQLFNTYYCADPDFAWKDNFIQRLAVNRFKNMPELDKTLWIAANESNLISSGITAMDSILKDKAPKKLYWKTVPYEYETHRSVRLKCIYDGLKFAYEGINAENLEYHPMNGILLKDKPVQVLLHTYPNLYYTLDGTEPSATSDKAGEELYITGPAVLKLRYISPKKKIDVASKGVFEIGEMFAAVSKPDSFEKGGLNYKYYEGKWERLPDFNMVRPVNIGILDSVLNVENIRKVNNFACLLTGYLKIDKDGYYIFGMDSTDGSKLFINNRLLIDHDGLHLRGRLQTFVVPLQKGFHPFRIEYFRQDGPASLGLIYRGPDMSEAGPVPADLFYYER